MHSQDFGYTLGGSAIFLPRPIAQGLCAQRNEKFLWGLKLVPNFVPNPLLPLKKVKIWNPFPSGKVKILMFWEI